MSQKDYFVLIIIIIISRVFFCIQWSVIAKNWPIHMTLIHSFFSSFLWFKFVYAYRFYYRSLIDHKSQSAIAMLLYRNLPYKSLENKVYSPFLDDDDLSCGQTIDKHWMFVMLMLMLMLTSLIDFVLLPFGSISPFFWFSVNNILTASYTYMHLYWMNKWIILYVPKL